MKVAQTENLRPNLVDLGDTQQMGQIEGSRSEHGSSNRTILWALIAADRVGARCSWGRSARADVVP